MSALSAGPPSNSSFSSKSPFLQLAIDSHSLGTFKTCPRLYYYQIILGLVPKEESVHLTFGLFLHKAYEVYQLARAEGRPHPEALEVAVADLLGRTLNRTLRRPWLSSDPNKNRGTLLRTAIWYLDQFQEDPLQTIILDDGKPAVELHFLFDSGFRTASGEPFLFTGWIDRLVNFASRCWVVDVKSTKRALDRRYFAQFTPFNQFSMYASAGQVAFHRKVEGIIVDAAQVLVSGSRFARQQIPRPPEFLDEWHQAQGHWLEQMETCAEGAQMRAEAGGEPSEAYPQNDTSCDKYFGCPMREICSRAPRARQQWLERDFATCKWDPLEERTDI